LTIEELDLRGHRPQMSVRTLEREPEEDESAGRLRGKPGAGKVIPYDADATEGYRVVDGVEGA
jgi:hypothetical protein